MTIESFASGKQHPNTGTEAHGRMLTETVKQLQHFHQKKSVLSANAKLIMTEQKASEGRWKRKGKTGLPKSVLYFMIL